MSTRAHLRISFEPHDDGPAKFVTEGLANYNIAVTGDGAWYPVQFFLRGEGDEILGGLLGQIWAGWLHVKILWVAEPARGQGHGTAMLAAAEDYARKRGCRGAHLETFSFQARPLYERLGYTVFGAIDEYPPGHSQFFLKKVFAT